MKTKKQIRSSFRNSVFQRDKYTCQICGKRYTEEDAEAFLDAHHITNRNLMPNGGYVKENGISLCKNGDPSCHELAEAQLITEDELYKKINSSYEKALHACSKSNNHD